MVSHPRDPSRKTASGQVDAKPAARGERVARTLARAGVASRREAERLIEAGRIALNGTVLTSPAVNVTRGDILTLDGRPIADREPSRLWRYHKPAGLITTHNDPKGRPTVFDRLPKSLPRVISIGRLDLTSEGLLLLTNDGDLARSLELPSSGVVRRYRARAFGRVTQEQLDRLKAGIVVDGVAYGSIDARLERGSGSNVWIGLALSEGKNREIRKVLEALSLKVNRLIRTGYGPFELGELAAGDVDEVSPRQLQKLLQGDLAAQPSTTPRPTGDKGARPLHRPSHPGPNSPTKPRVRPAAGAPKRPRAAPAEAADKPAYKPGWARPKAKAKRGPGKPPGRRGPAK